MEKSDKDDAAEAPPVINIWGKAVALGPFDRSYLALYHRWINDAEVAIHYVDRLAPYTLEEMEA